MSPLRVTSDGTALALNLHDLRRHFRSDRRALSRTASWRCTGSDPVCGASQCHWVAPGSNVSVDVSSRRHRRQMLPPCSAASRVRSLRSPATPPWTPPPRGAAWATVDGSVIPRDARAVSTVLAALDCRSNVPMTVPGLHVIGFAPKGCRCKTQGRRDGAHHLLRAVVGECAARRTREATPSAPER
jgi:hypothetical protein